MDNNNIRLTQNQTVFQYDDAIDDNTNMTVYHKDYIRIAEIPLYQQYHNARFQTSRDRITEVCLTLYNIIHNGTYRFINTLQLVPVNPNRANIFAIILNRLQYIANEYNHYDDYFNWLLSRLPTNIRNLPDGLQRNSYVFADSRYVDELEYQLRLARYIINYFISVIGEVETAKIFAKHYGDIVHFLFYRYYQ